VLGTPTTATSGRSPEFRKGSNPNPVEFAEDLIASGLLPTPNTMEHREIKTPEQIAKLKELSPGGYRNLREVVINELPNSLLPTPVASEGTKAPAQQDAETKGKTGQVWLSNVAKSISNDNEVMLLPTVQVDDAKNTGHNQNRRSTLASEVWLAETTTNWGNFAPAIERWESLTRVAPAPTKPDGKDGNHRLSAEFTEWMMGLPEGWVTAEDIGLKRNDQLKACGNGVVPQQAELALRILLEGLEFESTIRGGGDSDATNSNC
jgi:DNA (cytosine-5)-methyltransferase 1